MKYFFLFVILALFIVCPGVSTVLADETFFFWKGSAPTSVSWAPFDWEGQGRTSGFASSVSSGEFYDHTPDSDDDTELNQSLTFGLDIIGNQGAHHPTVLPGGVGTVSLWVYYDFDYGYGSVGVANTIYLSRQAGPDLVKGAYLGVVMEFSAANFKVVSSGNSAGINGPALIANDWNHLVFTDDGNTTKVKINDTDVNLSLPTGGNLWYLNFVDGIVQSNGTIEDGECPETFYIDDILCTSPRSSGIEVIDVPLTSNSITIDGVINANEIAGANSVTWNGTSTERPGVHAQFYGQWALPTPEDLTATVYLQNNRSKLYVSIDVIDDVISLKDGSAWWEEDSTEIYLDHDNSNSTSGATQISVRADNVVGNEGDYADWLVLRSKLKPDNKGWQIEAEFDMAARELVQGETYGFDISINDSDGENETGYQGAQEWLYASFEASYYNETYWGNIRILNEAVSVNGWDLF